MEVYIYISLFIVGLCFGSFFNVVGLRLSAGQSIHKPRSHCPKCGHVLSWYELIPVFSYIYLGGKCRTCKSHISPKYLIFELLTGILFMLSYAVFGYSGELLVSLFFVSLFIIICVSDLEYMLIEDSVIIFFLVSIIILRLIFKMPEDFITFNFHPYLETLIGGIFGFGLLFSIAIIGKKIYKQDAMGGGDIKLYGIIGLVLGFKLTFMSLFLASIIGSIIGLSLTLLRIIQKGTPIPFGPFIAVGSLIAYFIGPDLINWYLNLLFNM